ncbi:hypothetical protein QL285_089805 [Trifolium repens]|nr:hypothetical protein QL285_089805 [Trifolium repens]
MDTTTGSVNPASQLSMSTDVREESDNISGGVETSNAEHNSNDDVGSDGSEAEAIVIRDMGDILKIDIENFCLSDLRRDSTSNSLGKETGLDKKGRYDSGVRVM